MHVVKVLEGVLPPSYLGAYRVGGQFHVLLAVRGGQGQRQRCLSLGGAEVGGTDGWTEGGRGE